MDENRIIKIEELEVGDEIIIPSNGSLRYFRILRKPTINPKTTRYGAVKCSTKERIRNAGSKWQRTVTDYTYHCTAEDHNAEMSVNLCWKTIWLVRRAGYVK